MATYYIPSSSGWASQKYLPSSSGYSSHADAGRLRVVIDRSYDINTNKSTLTFRLQIYSEDYSGTFRARQGGTLKVNGSTIETFEQGSTSSTHFVVTDKDDSWRYMTKGTQTTATWSKTLDHDSDGKLTVTFATDFYIYYTVSSKSYVMRWQNSGSITWTEPRMSDVSASNGYFGSAIPITVTRKNSGFTHTVTVASLGRTETIATRSTASSLSWTPAVATYAPLLNNGMSATATIYCDTYNGTTLIGSRTASITVSLRAADVAPSLALTIEDATTAPGQSQSCLDYYGAFVATKSKIKVTTVPTLIYGASVSTTSITANGATYNASPATTDPIASPSLNTVSGKIVDSRQQSATASQAISILAYDVPQIIAMSVHRCQQDGTLDDGGAYCRFDFEIAVTPLNNHNSRTLKAGIKLLSAQNYTEYPVTLSDYSETGSVIVPADTEVSHDVRLALSDDFSTTIVTSQLSSAYVRPLNFRAGGLGIGIGKVSEYDKTVDLAADWTLLKNGQPVPLSDFDNDSGFPSVDDDSVSSEDTWSSQKINSTFASGTSDGWTYYRIGTICFAWYYRQRTGIDITAEWVSGVYRSGEIELAPYPTFLNAGYNVSACLAVGSQGSGIGLGRVMDSSGAIRGYLTRPAPATGANCAVMVFAVGTWKG